MSATTTSETVDHRYKNLGKGHLLESIDDDVQEVDRLRKKIRKESLSDAEETSSDTRKAANMKKSRSGPADFASGDSSGLNSENGTPETQKSSNPPFYDSEEQLDDGNSPAKPLDTHDTFYKQSKNKDSFRQYELACSRVSKFYREQHAKQTVAFNIQARVNFKTKMRAKMTIWEALVKLNRLIDQSDPDTELSQIDHAIQTAEAIRRDGKPRWMQLTGLIHDLGKLLYFFDAEGQWDVVGDTFPVGCKFSDKIIFHEYFKRNPDYHHPIYSKECGIYTEHCGLSNVMLSWGHDEYMFHIAKAQSTLPDEALAMIRYHSFYPWHSEGAYRHLMNKEDEAMLKAVQEFNPYDLYSKADQKYDIELLKPYYLELIDEFFPNKIVEF